MRRVIIICEGETEQEFCKLVLSKYFANKSIQIQAPRIKKSMGGIVKWKFLKKQITTHLKTDANAIVTTLFDYYGIYEKHKFPKWDIAKHEVDKVKRMTLLENAMKEDIDNSNRFRFIPYLQLHEFEGLLFNEIEIFYQQIPKDDLVGEAELQKTFDQFDNPEMINDKKDTAPSKRLRRIIKGYNKIVHGNILAESIGVIKIRNKCPRFNNWLAQIVDAKI